MTTLSFLEQVVRILADNHLDRIIAALLIRDLQLKNRITSGVHEAILRLYSVGQGAHAFAHRHDGQSSVKLMAVQRKLNQPEKPL